MISGLPLLQSDITHQAFPKGVFILSESSFREEDLDTLIWASIEELKHQQPLSPEDLENAPRPSLGDRISLTYYRAVRLLGLRDLLGQRLASIILYRSGKRFASRLNIKSFDELVGILKEFSLANLAKLETDTDPIVVEITECATCTGLPNLGEPVCSFEAGMIAGSLETILQRDVVTEETRCTTMGNNVCRFESTLYPLGKGPAELVDIGIDGSNIPHVINALAAKAVAALSLAEELGQKTERLRYVTESLALHRDRLEAILNSTQDGIIMVDLTGRLVMANRMFGEFFGVDEEEIIGLPDVEVRRKIISRLKDPLGFQNRLKEFLANPEMIAEDTLEIVSPRPRLFRRVSLPVRDRRGTIIGRIFVFHDITVERELERMRADFISMVSHELRTPLTSIKGSIGLILGGAAGETTGQIRDLLLIARNNSERLIRLINDILDLSKIESGKMEIRPEPGSIKDCVQQSVDGVRELAREVDIKLSVEIPDNLPAVMIDYDRIQQVMTNLLSNAIKFTPAGGSIKVIVEELEDWIQVRVMDTGIGIPQEDLERIFDKFHQVDASSTREKGGSGLGLAICKAIIQEHGGHIRAESLEKGGTTIIFRIPKYLAEEELPVDNPDER